jgi:hypothetical protein
MVTGEKPYDVKTLSSFQLQLKIVQEPLRKTNSSWDHWIGKATSKSENDRFGSCSTWLRELNQGNQNQPIADNSTEATLVQNTSQSDQTIIEKPKQSEILLEGSVFDGNGDLKYGKVDLKGNWIIQPVFDSLGEFDNHGYCMARLNEKSGFIDRNGNWIIQPIYEDLGCYYEKEFCGAKINEKFGLIDRKGNWIIQPIFEHLGSYDQKEFCCAYINGKGGFIDRKGDWIIKPLYKDYLYILKYDDKDYCMVGYKGKCGFIDREGEWVIKPIYEKLGKFDNKDYCEATINEKRGFIDRNGNWIIQPIFDSISPLFLDFDDLDYCLVLFNRKYGYIDRKGNWVIKPVFDSLGEFDNQGYCEAEKNGKWGFIDRNGKWIIKPVFGEKEYGFDSNELCIMQLADNNDYYVRYTLINRNGKEIVDPTFEIEQYGNLYKVSKGPKYGYINSNGQWIILPIFDFVLKDIEGDPMIWDENTKNWIFSQSNSNVRYSFIDEETVEEYFSHLVGKEKVYLSSDLPSKKIQSFITHFNKEFFDEGGEVLVYYDDTVWGKGDNGFLVYKKNEYVYLFFSVYGGVKYCVCFEDDGQNMTLTACEFNKKGVQITVESQESEEYIYELGFNNDAGRALVKFIEENT